MEGPPGRPARVQMPSAMSTVALISRIQATGSRTRPALSQSIFVPSSPRSAPRWIRQYVSNQVVCAIINLRHLSGHQRMPELRAGTGGFTSTSASPGGVPLEGAQPADRARRLGFHDAAKRPPAVCRGPCDLVAGAGFEGLSGLGAGAGPADNASSALGTRA